MPLRRLLRVSVPDGDVREIAEHVARRQGGDDATHRVLDADNWFSIPIVVDDQWFAKIVAPQHLHVHGLLTRVRNAATTSASAVDHARSNLVGEPMFEPHADVLEMARHDREALDRIRRLGVDVPEPLDVFRHGDYAVLVLEYLPDFEPLDGLPVEDVRDRAPELFRMLKAMHDAGMAHGDIHADNILLAPRDGEQRLHVIDATRVNKRAHKDARAYDLACALASLAPLIGAEEAVAAARRSHAPSHLQRARPFLDYLRLRPQEFDAGAVKRVIDE